MRLIDADEITDEDIRNALGTKYTSCVTDIRDLLDEQPTINPQYLATVKIDFSKEDIEKLIEQKTKEFIDININRLKNLLMVYFNIKKHGDCRYGMMYHENFYNFDEDDINDIIRFIKENK